MLEQDAAVLGIADRLVRSAADDDGAGGRRAKRGASPMGDVGRYKRRHPEQGEEVPPEPKPSRRRRRPVGKQNSAALGDERDPDDQVRGVGRLGTLPNDGDPGQPEEPNGEGGPCPRPWSGYGGKRGPVDDGDPDQHDLPTVRRSDSRVARVSDLAVVYPTGIGIGVARGSRPAMANRASPGARARAGRSTAGAVSSVPPADDGRGAEAGRRRSSRRGCWRMATRRRPSMGIVKHARRRS